MRAHIGDEPGQNLVDQVRRYASATPTVAVRLRTSGPWKIIVVDGEMDIQVLPLLPDLRGGGVAHVVFDLTRVTFMDASALGSLLDRQQWVARSGGRVRLVASRPVLRLLGLTGTSDLFRTFATLEQALSGSS